MLREFACTRAKNNAELRAILLSKECRTDLIVSSIYRTPMKKVRQATLYQKHINYSHYGKTRFDLAFIYGKKCNVES